MDNATPTKQVVFFAFIETATTRHERRALVPVVDEDTLLKDFFDWMNETLAGIEKEHGKALITNCNLIR